MKSKHAFLLAFLLTALIAGNIYFISLFHSEATATITRIIDGDTLELKDKTIIRLENINAPERNTKGYEASKNFLKTFENKTVTLQISGLDKYRRTLAKIYAPKYLNLEIVRKGFANKYLVDSSESKEFAKAEQQAIKNEKGIWQKSEFFNCFQTTINKETISIENTCAITNLANWIIKDESRKQYKFPSTQFDSINLHTFNGTDNTTDLFWNLKSNIWDKNRNSVYIFDAEGKLAHFETYGYY